MEIAPQVFPIVGVVWDVAHQAQGDPCHLGGVAGPVADVFDPAQKEACILLCLRVLDEDDGVCHPLSVFAPSDGAWPQVGSLHIFQAFLLDVPPNNTSLHIVGDRLLLV